MKLWVVLHERWNQLFAFHVKPKYDKNFKVWYIPFYKLKWQAIHLPDDWFPELTAENSPQRIEIKLIKRLFELSLHGKNKQLWKRKYY